MTVRVGWSLDRQAGESDQQRAAVVAHAKDRVGEGAGGGIGKFELPRVDSDLNRALRGRGACQLASAAEAHGRSGSGWYGGALKDVGTGERGNHHLGGRAQQLGG